MIKGKQLQLSLALKTDDAKEGKTLGSKAHNIPPCLLPFDLYRH